MNFIQIGYFAVYFISTLLCGSGIYRILGGRNNAFINKSVLLGEVLLLGSIFIVGELLFLSLIGLFKAQFLWSVIALNLLFLFDRNVRNLFFAEKNLTFDIPLFFFIALLAVFIFRNIYFTVDVDSLSHYLVTQKIWLSYGTSIVGGPTSNSALFVPQFDVLPSSLSLGIFAQETLFPQLINLFWRIIVLILVFGYTSYRFNRYYGLSAALLVALNDHFFFSGDNRWVLINAAVIAFLFAAAYNFWEARRQNNAFRLMLALIFLFQMLANKMQVVYIFLFLFTIGIIIQQDIVKKIKEIILNKRWLLITLISVFFMSLWYLKNFIVTANPVFPVLAGNLKTFGFTAEQGEVISKIGGGISPGLFLKYMSYLFIWPGINAGKIVIVTICFLPLFLFRAYTRDNKDRDFLIELFFWLSLCILAVMGTSLACHWEPRYHRYPIAIMAFTAVISVQFIFTAIGIRNKLIIGTVIFLLALKGGFNEGYRVIFDSGGFFVRPSFKENTDTLLNKIHTIYAVRKVYPQIDNIISSLRDNSDKVGTAAWDASFNFPLFLLPVRPLVSPWVNTAVNWDSYKSAELVISDLKKHNIEWIMQMQSDKLIFISVKQYAQEIVKLDRHPNKKWATYDLPPELSDVNW